MKKLIILVLVIGLVYSTESNDSGIQNEDNTIVVTWKSLKEITPVRKRTIKNYHELTESTLIIGSDPELSKQWSYELKRIDV